MKRVADISLAVIVVLCLAAMMQSASIVPLRSVHPIVMLPVLGGGCLAFVCAWIAIVFAGLRAPPDDRRPTRVRAVAACLAVVVTGMLVLANAPVRVAFRASRGAFDDLAASLPSDRDTNQIDVDRQAGLYRVDAYAVDAAGGTYFRVGSSSLVDTTSWGFCVRPDAKTSPFGASGYELTELGDGWYWFTANDDWY